jgi:hypothetical protein
MFTYLKMLCSDPSTFKRAVRVGIEHVGWALGTRRHEKPADARKFQQNASANTQAV